MVRIAPVNLRYNPKTLWFDAGELEVHAGDGVVVSTARGTEFGRAAGEVFEASEEQVSSLKSPLKPVRRVATEEDEERARELEQKSDEALPIFKEMAAETNEDMHPVSVEYLFDGDKAVFYFEAEERVDFRELVRNLASRFHVRVDMRQIGVRDEARMVGGLGHCGQELCCKRMGGEFSPVSIRMAKEQNLSLNPQKISGLCGRLMCCLRYEYDAYKDFNSRAPKQNSQVETPEGPAKVVELDVPRELVSLKVGEGKPVKVPLADFEPPEEGNRPKVVGQEAWDRAQAETALGAMGASAYYATEQLSGEDKLADPTAVRRVGRGSEGSSGSQRGGAGGSGSRGGSRSGSGSGAGGAGSRGSQGSQSQRKPRPRRSTKVTTSSVTVVSTAEGGGEGSSSTSSGSRQRSSQGQRSGGSQQRKGGSQGGNASGSGSQRNRSGSSGSRQQSSRQGGQGNQGGNAQNRQGQRGQQKGGSQGQGQQSGKGQQGSQGQQSNRNQQGSRNQQGQQGGRSQQANKGQQQGAKSSGPRPGQNSSGLRNPQTSQQAGGSSQTAHAGEDAHRRTRRRSHTAGGTEAPQQGGSQQGGGSSQQGGSQQQGGSASQDGAKSQAGGAASQGAASQAGGASSQPAATSQPQPQPQAGAASPSGASSSSDNARQGDDK